MKSKRILGIGIIFILLGIIWSLQGGGLVRGNSVMDGNPAFIYVGSFVTLIGFLLLVASYRPGPRSQQPVPA